MQVDRIGYDPRTGQYIIFPTDPSYLNNLQDWIRFNCRSAISPYLRETNHGWAVSFGIMAANVDSTIALFLQNLHPSLPSTAELLLCDYLRSPCLEHFMLHIEFTMVPSLPLQADEDTIARQISDYLYKQGLPYILPLTGEIPVIIHEGVRLAAKSIGVFAQGLRIQVRTEPECIVCSKS